MTEKSTGEEYAVKIIDISGEKGEGDTQVEQTKRDTYREIRVLRMCGGHPNISQSSSLSLSIAECFYHAKICSLTGTICIMYLQP